MDRTLEDIKKEMGELDILIAEQQAVQAEAGAAIARAGVKRAKLIAEFTALAANA